MIVYGKVHCDAFSAPGSILQLTDTGWNLVDQEIRPEHELALEDAFNIMASPSDFSPADGDPMAAAVLKLAGLLGGIAELFSVSSPPAGTIY